jgi:hypothetical protein
MGALPANIAPSQPYPSAKACVDSPYRVGRQHGECPRRTRGQARQSGEPAFAPMPEPTLRLALGLLQDRYSKTAVRDTIQLGAMLSWVQ